MIFSENMTIENDIIGHKKITKKIKLQAFIYILISAFDAVLN